MRLLFISCCHFFYFFYKYSPIAFKWRAASFFNRLLCSIFLILPSFSLHCNLSKSYTCAAWWTHLCSSTISANLSCGSPGSNTFDSDILLSLAEKLSDSNYLGAEYIFMRSFWLISDKESDAIVSRLAEDLLFLGGLKKESRPRDKLSGIFIAQYN